MFILYPVIDRPVGLELLLNELILHSPGDNMSPRPDVSEERKDQILDAARDVFTEKGLQKARMDDIVERSGLSKGTLYWYFKSKDNIVIGIFERLFDRELADLANLKTDSRSASDRLMTYTARVIKDIFRLLKFAPISFEFLSFAFRRKYFKEAFKIYLQTHLDILVPIIQQGTASGEFRQVDPQEAAIAICAIFEGTILLWVYDNSLVDPQKHIRSGMEIFIEGMKP
jgi:AcrR family transcriptional regulator